MRSSPSPRLLATLVFLVLGLVAGGSCIACFATLSPEQQELVQRVEAVENLLGRHGYTDDVRFMEMLRQEAVALDLPVAEARVRLIMGRRVTSSSARAQLELAAEAFREHDEPAWEARARLALGRLLFGRFLRDATFLSDHRDRAVAELEDAARLAQRAEDPLTAGEAHWQLGTIHRLEESPGRAIRGFERAEEAFRMADDPLLVLVARTEMARVHRSIDDLDEAQAILRLALADLSDAADVDELVRLRTRLQEMTSPASATDGFRATAEGLRHRGYPELAAHMDRLGDFFAERGERLHRDGWSQADLEAMGKIQMRAPRPETEPLFPPEQTRLGGSIVPPLDEFIARYPDREVARRVLDLELRGELDETERALRRIRLDRELASPEPTPDERVFEGLLAEAKARGTMPDLPVEWFVERIREAPETYRDGQALPDWVELRAADLYHRLGRRLGDSFQGLPEETTGSIYHPRNAWQARYCERLRTALQQVGREKQFRCDARNGFRTLSRRFQGAAALDSRYVSEGSRLDALEDRRRRLERLLKDPAHLSKELDESVLETFLDGIFFNERHPNMSPSVIATPLNAALAVREVTDGIPVKAEANDLEERIGRVSCALAQQQKLLRRLALLAERSGYKQPAEAHRAREESLRAELRQKTRPGAYTKVGDAEEYEASWGVGCPASATPSFLDLKDLEAPSEDRARPSWKMRVERATESLDSGEYREAARVLRTVADAGIDRPETRATVLHGLGRAYAGLGEPERALAAFRRAAAAWEEVVGGFDRPAELASYFGGAAETYDRLIELSIDSGRPEEAFRHAERARARAFLRRLGTAPIGASGLDGVPEPLVEDMNRLRTQLVRLENLRDTPDLGQAAGKAMTEGELERRLETVRKSLLQVVRRVDAARGGGGESFTDLATASPAEIRAALPPDTVLVEYHLLPERGFAWVVDRDGLEVVELPRRRELVARGRGGSSYPTRRPPGVPRPGRRSVRHAGGSDPSTPAGENRRPGAPRPAPRSAVRSPLEPAGRTPPDRGADLDHPAERERSARRPDRSERDRGSRPGGRRPGGLDGGAAPGRTGLGPDRGRGARRGAVAGRRGDREGCTESPAAGRPPALRHPRLPERDRRGPPLDRLDPGARCALGRGR